MLGFWRRVATHRSGDLTKAFLALFAVAFLVFAESHALAHDSDEAASCAACITGHVGGAKLAPSGAVLRAPALRLDPAGPVDERSPARRLRLIDIRSRSPPPIAL
jgi:hypothetical protein